MRRLIKSYGLVSTKLKVFNFRTSKLCNFIGGVIFEVWKRTDLRPTLTGMKNVNENGLNPFFSIFCERNWPKIYLEIHESVS